MDKRKKKEATASCSNLPESQPVDKVQRRESKKYSSKMKKYTAKMEALNRLSRRKNIVIRGLSPTTGSLRDQVDDFIRDEFGITGSVVEARFPRSNRYAIVARMSNLDHKARILKNAKTILHGRNISINHDLTPMERAIYRIITGCARLEKLKGRDVKVRYRSICIDGRWFHWNNQLQKLMSIGSRSVSERRTIIMPKYNNNKETPHNSKQPEEKDLIRQILPKGHNIKDNTNVMGGYPEQQQQQQHQTQQAQQQTRQQQNAQQTQQQQNAQQTQQQQNAQQTQQQQNAQQTQQQQNSQQTQQQQNAQQTQQQQNAQQTQQQQNAQQTQQQQNSQQTQQQQNAQQTQQQQNAQQTQQQQNSQQTQQQQNAQQTQQQQNAQQTQQQQNARQTQQQQNAQQTQQQQNAQQTLKQPKVIIVPWDLPKSQTPLFSSVRQSVISTPVQRNVTVSQGAVAGPSAGQPIHNQPHQRPVIKRNLIIQKTPRGHRIIWDGILECSVAPMHPTEPQKPPVQYQFLASSADSELKADSWPQKLMVQLLPEQLLECIEARRYLMDKPKCVRFYPTPCKALEYLTTVMSAKYFGYVDFPSVQSSRTCDIKVLLLLYTVDKKVYFGLIPNDQTAFMDRLSVLIQNQKCKDALMREGQLAMLKRNLIIQKIPRGHRMIWQGILECSVTPIHPTETQKPPVQYQFLVSSADSELKADSWPQKLMMQLLPEELLECIESRRYLDKPKYVMFHPTPCEALDYLTTVMSAKYFGYVDFPSVQSSRTCDIKVLVLLYTVDKKVYFGVIPNNQEVFIDRLSALIQDQKCKEALRRQGKVRLSRLLPFPADDSKRKAT